jgi:hypothetical protein
LTVCIAAASIAHDPALVFCVDMKGSVDYSSSETTWKWRPLQHGFHALMAGTTTTARELASFCNLELKVKPNTINDLKKALRRAIGRYKSEFADAHVQSRLGISYDAFRKTGRKTLPDDLFNQVSAEIRLHYSCAELIVAGFQQGPVMAKISSDIVWSCDDFAVIGSGTLLAESSLYHREQTFLYDLNTTLYNVYEAKRLAEKESNVGKKTCIYIVRPGLPTVQSLTPEGFKNLEKCFAKFGPQIVRPFDFTDTFIEVALRGGGRVN